MSIVLVGGAIAVGAILLALATRSRASQGPLPARAVFQLQDLIDDLCLGPHGFVPCDASSLWTLGIVGRRKSLVSFLHPSAGARCLERVQAGPWDSKVRLGNCKARSALAWDVAPTEHGGVLVSSDGGQHCLARRWNLAAMQPCDFGFTSFAVVDTPLHSRGFLLVSRGGASCFDGLRFRKCDTEDAELYWDVTVRFDKPRGEGYYSFFKFQTARSTPTQQCLSASGKRGAMPTLADCHQTGAKWWAMIGGRLEHAKLCLERESAGAARMQPCSDDAPHQQVVLRAAQGPLATATAPPAMVGASRGRRPRVTIAGGLGGG